MCSTTCSEDVCFTADTGFPTGAIDKPAYCWETIRRDDEYVWYFVDFETERSQDTCIFYDTNCTDSLCPLDVEADIFPVQAPQGDGAMAVWPLIGLLLLAAI